MFIEIVRHEDTFHLGKVTKLYSFKGEVILYLDVDDPSKYSGLDSVLIDENGTLVPYFIERSTPSSAGRIRVKFEDVDSEEAARRIVGKDLRLPLSMLPPSGKNDFYRHEVIGFVVHDKDHGEVGPIDHIIESPGNPLFSIKVDYNEVLIPFNDDIISKVDKKKRIVYVDCPEGLLDMYLGDE